MHHAAENDPTLAAFGKRLDWLVVGFMKKGGEFAALSSELDLIENELLREAPDAELVRQFKGAVIERRWYFALMTNQSIEFCESLFLAREALGCFEKLARGSMILIAARHWLEPGEKAYVVEKLELLGRELSPDDEWEALQLSAATELLADARAKN